MNAFAERWISSARRECTDQILIVHVTRRPARTFEQWAQANIDNFR